jgi:hypothetical protein
VVFYLISEIQNNYRDIKIAAEMIGPNSLENGLKNQMMGEVRRRTSKALVCVKHHQSMVW